MRQTARQATPLLLAAIIGSILLIDRPLATMMHTLHKPLACVWLTWIADVPVPASVLGLAGGGIAWLAGWRPGAVGRVLLAVCIATLTADAAKDVLKFAFGRTWPETWVGGNPSWIGNQVFAFAPFHGKPGWASFPSGHTTVIAAPCAVLWRAWKRWRWVWGALPALVAAGLLGCDYHFLSDCLAGAGLGGAIGCGVGAILAAGPAVPRDGTPQM